MRRSILSRITNRLGILSVSAGIMVAAAAAPGTAAAECPNEAVRVQQGVTARLPECRGYELATPTSKNGQEALVPKDTTGLEIQDQAAATGPGTTWAMTGGPPGSESAGEFVDGISTGTTAGSLWSDLSLAPETRFHPIGTPGPRNGGRFEYYSPNLTCGIEDTPLPQAKNPGEATPELAPGESASEEIDQLYMWTAPAGTPTESNRGSKTLVTSTRPHEPLASGPYGGGGYRVAGASEDCGHVSFDTGSAGYELETEKGSGIFAPKESLYEWSAATGPKVASILPDGKPAESVVPFSAGEKSSDLNSVSADGSKVFFTATVDKAEGAEAAGTQQVYARVNSSTTVHVSATDTATADNGSRFQAASVDGNRVYFLANYGLTSTTSKGTEAASTCELAPAVTTSAGQGCDLYQYEFSTGKLTDLTADEESATGDKAGANARGLVGVSKDGSYVYFSTAGRLVAGEGNSAATNEANKEANVYAYHAGHVSYVTTILENEAGGGKAGVQSEEQLDAVAAPGHGLTFLVARVSPNGQHALIASYAKLTTYNNIDKNTGKPDPELYEYTFAEGKPSLICVSCNPTGEQPVTNVAEAHKPFSPLGPYIEVRGGSNLHRSLLNDGRVFFDSYTPLVTQEPAVTEMVHPYEWRPNGVNGCATAAGCVTLLDSGKELFPSYFVGASEDGENVYISTPQPLALQDEDGGLRDIYDVREGGGIFKPEASKGCSPTEDTCQEKGETFNQQPIGSGSTTSNQPGLTLVTPQTKGTPAVSPVKITGHSASKKTVTIVIYVPAAGTVTVSGAGIVGTRTSETRPGTYRLTVALTAKSKAALRNHRKVKISVHVTFTPTSGSSSSAALTSSLR